MKAGLRPMKVARVSSARTDVRYARSAAMRSGSPPFFSQLARTVVKLSNSGCRSLFRATTRSRAASRLASSALATAIWASTTSWVLALTMPSQASAAAASSSADSGTRRSVSSSEPIVGSTTRGGRACGASAFWAFGNASIATQASPARASVLVQRNRRVVMSNSWDARGNRSDASSFSIVWHASDSSGARAMRAHHLNLNTLAVERRESGSVE